jgi:hypothetical protein
MAMRPRPASNPEVAGTRAKAAAWAPDGSLVVLVARGALMSCVTIRGGRLVAEATAVGRAMRVAVLPSGAILTLAKDGKGRLTGSAIDRRASLQLHINDLVVCQGIAYAAGPNRSLAKFDEATATWAGMGLRIALDPLLPTADKFATDGVHSIVEGANGPIVGVYANSYHETLVMEWNGTAWIERGKVANANALARSPSDDVVYAVGENLSAVDAHGKVTQIGALDDHELWACGWVTTARGGMLLGSTLATVSRVAADAALTELLPHGDGEVPNHHSLFTRGSQAAFVRAGKVHVLDGEAFAVVPLA